jgi:fatty-acyl-CoA synthase
MLVNAAPEQIKNLPHAVLAATGGAAPPTAIIAGMERLGFTMQHVYGLTEVYGPSTTCEPQPDWPALSVDERAKKMSRQGVPNITQEDITVLADDGSVVPADGKTIGELAIRGNVVMKGYLKNPAATEAAFRRGWFLTGDLGVLHPDSYTEIKDRSKDIIISGGENISSLEVEEVLYRHPAIREAAVVAKPDEKWGEIPCAFLVLKDNATLTETDITNFCRANMAGFKIPKKIVFQELPKTSTGKIQKNILRERAREL